MSTKLDRLLYDIAPERTIDEVAACVDEAVNTFSWPDMKRIREPEQVKSLIARLFAHIESRVLDINPARQAHPVFDWSQAKALLKSIYGAQVEHAVVRKVLTGVDGGFSGLVRDLTRAMTQEYSGNCVRARIREFWQGLSSNKERFAVIEEYVNKYGRFLPGELLDDGAVPIHGSFLQTLEKHAEMMATIRRTGRAVATSRPPR